MLERFGHTVLAAVGDARSLIAAVEEHRPEVAVVDVRMPPGFSDEGLRVTRELRSRQPSLAVLILSRYVEQTFTEELGRLTAREREVPAPMAEGLMPEGPSNAANSRAPVVTDAAVAKRMASVLLKLDPPPAPDGHRRVKAVPAFLRG
ncbi:response regulator [Streptomyces inhibens]|uniref:response regulator n=1 Tax=Streptomyces inhibens TaxID=2293571 RepID=UPI001FD190AD|nr:response regulator [Streptomyces inhibens]